MKCSDSSSSFALKLNPTPALQNRDMQPEHHCFMTPLNMAVT